MVNVQKLKGRIIEKGYCQKDMAAIIKKTPKTFYQKMKEGRFDSDEISAMMSALDIKDPTEIFFAEDVT